MELGLSPQEIKNKEFKRVALGYSPREVVEFLDQVAKTWEKVQKQERDLRNQLAAAQREIENWKKKEPELAEKIATAEAQIQKRFNEAEAEAQKGFAEVEEKAKEIRHQTEAWLESLIQEIEEAERQKANFFTALKSALDSHYALIEEETSTKTPISERLSQFLKGIPKEIKNPAAVESH